MSPPPLRSLHAEAAEQPTPAHLLCCGCQAVALNTWQTSHGCRLCQLCYNRLPSDGRVRCPGNHEEGEEADVGDESELAICRDSCTPDIACRRELLRLKVLCPNRSAGCEWLGEWRLAESHLAECQLEQIECQLCQQAMPRAELELHSASDCPNRKINCPDCQQPVELCKMESEHRSLLSGTCCRKFVSECPHCGQGSPMTRSYFELTHLAECEQKPRACRFTRFGCKFVGGEREMQEHRVAGAWQHVEMLEAGVTDDKPAVVDNSETLKSLNAMEERLNRMFDMFKKLQVNVANWADSTIKVEEAVEVVGGVSRLGGVLRAAADSARQTGQA